VLLGEAAGQESGVVVVKTVPFRRFGVLRRTKLARDADAWGKLVAFDISVPGYIARVRGRNIAGELVESLIMGRTEGHSLLWEIAYGQRSVREDYGLARAVGELTTQLVEPTGMFNKDHKPSNIIVRCMEGGYGLTLIDFDGFATASRGHEVEMLAKLAIECIGCGVLPRRSVLMRVIRSCCGSRPHRQWREIEQLIAEHGDPIPKDDPLEFDRRMMGLD
jgi:hypothetical protein